MHDAECFMNDFDHGCDTVGGTRCSSDDVVLSWIVQVVINTHHDIQCACFFDWRSDHHSFYALAQIVL